MTTEEMKIALLWHFRFKLQYPLVVTECKVGNYLADILAIKKDISVEIEVKQNFSEIIQDLRTKRHKHNKYLNLDEIKPNKFYFALPSDRYQKNHLEKIPKYYGLIRIEKLYDLQVAKSASYLTREKKHLDKLKEALMQRLTAENIDLRLQKINQAR